jgi:hypothetical protein
MAMAKLGGAVKLKKNKQWEECHFSIIYSNTLFSLTLKKFICTKVSNVRGLLKLYTCRATNITEARSYTARDGRLDFWS